MPPRASDSAGQSFDVASNPRSRARAVTPSAPCRGGFPPSNATLKILIAEAYHVYDFQISGGPKCLATERYDIEAKLAEGAHPTSVQLRGMLQELLAELFNLAIHRETKDLPVYALTVSKGGPKFQRSQDPGGEPYYRLFQRRQITAQRAPLAWLAHDPVRRGFGRISRIDDQVDEPRLQIERHVIRRDYGCTRIRGDLHVKSPQGR